MTKQKKRTEPQTRVAVAALIGEGFTLSRACAKLGIPYEKGRRIVGQKAVKRAVPGPIKKGQTETSPGRLRLPDGAPQITQALTLELRAFYASHFLLGHNFEEVQHEFLRFARIVWRTMTIDPEVLTLAAESGIPHSDGRERPEVDFDERYLDED